MSCDNAKTTQCQERTKDPLEMFHSGHLVKICAPMVRYSKLAFRTLVRKYNCDLCYTPMIVAADFVRSIKARDSEFTTNKGDCPLIVQFAANDAQLLSDAAQIVCPYANGIDINCGCPQRWAITEGYGACLINKPELVQDMVKQVRSQVENPKFSVSIKIRSGRERAAMTLQWAAVASFLYTEIGLILTLCLPFISPQRWHKIFTFPLWSKIATYWNKAFLTIIVLLIVLFLDAVREVKKYSISHGLEKNSNSNPSAYEHVQMKLFRAQRNLYISGFSLFLWLVLRRLVTLITQLAKELRIKGILKIQADSNNDAAKKYLEENERLKQALEKSAKGDEQITDTENKYLMENMEKLKTELKKTSDGNFLCMFECRKNNLTFYTVKFLCFP
ncbi:tRNA-dihydrouridine(20a/20b) synthase [NAD(P)+]-like isoform X1 [Macrotis lagotis]|uniref:tRNA-dihydrouridine(20a/20b) synthase [NAD(P)+]-like isoform X1 n=1 Tax=Macrotis lagotis TaxID=92651 RepID=UPI003D687EDE